MASGSSSSSTSTESSSSSYLPASLSFLVANFQSFITLKLETSNYFAWKTQVENALRATCLSEYIDGSVVIPTSHIVDTSGNTVPNPEFSRWNTVDRMLLSCLIATLTPPILPHVVGSDHTFQLWLKLEEKFSVLSRSHIHDLKRKLYSLHKTGTMETYLDSIKEIVQKLAASGTQIEDEELIFHTVNGLKKGYKSLKQMVRNTTEPLTFSGVSSMLMAEELHISQDQVDSSSTILVAPHQNPNPTPILQAPITPNPSSSYSGPMPFPNTAVQTPSGSTSFQFPFPVASSQAFLPTFPQPTFNGQRFNRNNNRFRGNQFSKPFFPNYQGSSTPQMFSPGSCQICGKTNHQASTCHHRQNLGYRPFARPFGQFGNHFGNHFGQQTSIFPSQNPPGFQSQNSQAFYVGSGPINGYGEPSTVGQSEFALHMSSPYNGGSYPTAPCAPPYFSQFGDNSASSFGSAQFGGTSSQPWYFDSGATSHVTHDASRISLPYEDTSSASVTVGNGQTIPVTHSGQSYSSTPSPRPLSQGALPPSSFF
ncbi:uncharacterized protein LOC131311786 [Rhododendron vialii]|uniref:uncharacterized protein LOC131311786 n=1 Tax=Rhododendron vialii TaxID=182163 RepID=UPI00265EE483|nr:uncharacterized protein LOC131311786 [Rhododendron vialii]